MINYKIALILGIIALLVIASVILRIRKIAQSKDNITSNTSHNTNQNNQKTDKFISRNTENLSKDLHAIRPQNNQQRNLTREVGGLEEGKVGSEKENKKLHELSIKDIWDERSEEVDKMGSHIPLKGSNKESMLWRNKKAKLEAKKAAKEGAIDLKDGIGANLAGKNPAGKEFNSSIHSGGFRQMIKARQDHSHEGGITTPISGGGRGL